MSKRTSGKKQRSGQPRTFDKRDAEVNALLRFERLLSDLSATFVNLPSEQVDQEIERWMGRIGTFLDMKVGTLAQLSEDQTRVRFTHTWAAEGLESLPARPAASRWPWVFDQIRRGNIVQFTNVEDLPKEANIDKQSFIAVGCMSDITIPLSVGGTIVGALSFNSRFPGEPWPDSFVERFRLLGDVFANALMRRRKDKALHKAFQEIEALKEQLEVENVYLRQQVRLFRNYEDLIGNSAAIQQVLRQVEQVAQSSLTISERFALDPVANTIAVAVLLGMLVSVVLIGLNFTKVAPSGPRLWPNWALILLISLGLLAAGYMTYVEITETSAVCGPIGNCNLVQQSSYARLFGLLPVGLLGMIGYLGILVAWLIVQFGKLGQQRLAALAMWGLVWFGTLFSIYLTFLEPFVIGASCAWCLTSAVVMTLLLWGTTPIAQAQLQKRAKSYRRSRPPASPVEG